MVIKSSKARSAVFKPTTMFEYIGKALIAANEEDQEKVKKRQSKFLQSKAQMAEKEMTEKLGEANQTGVPGETKDSEGTPNRLSTEIEQEEDDEDIMEDRAKWGDDGTVLLYMLGYAVGLTNVWRFPFLCYEFGGGAFLIPYFITLFCCAYPFVYLELLIGQFSQVGAIAAWKLVPLFKGVGICMVVISYLETINTNAVVTWCLFYVFQTIFKHPLPWISCDNGFGKKRNGQIDPELKRWSHVTYDVSEVKNWHTKNCSEFYADSGTDDTLRDFQRLPGSEFLRGRVQRMWSSGFADRETFNFTHDENGMVWYGLDVENLGSYNIDTMMALVICTVVIFGCVLRGIKLNNKLILVIVMIPYIVLALLVFRGSGLHGAGKGLRYLYAPNISKLADRQTWSKATEQVFLSTGGALGVHLTFASHNRLSHRVLHDATITVLVNAVTSLLAASLIFMFLGHVEASVGRKIEAFLVSGPEMMFELMADVLGELAHANFYSFVFYMMLLLLGLATSVSSLMCARTALIDILPMSIKYRVGSRIMLSLFLAFVHFFASSLHMTRGGLHTFNFYDTFMGAHSLKLSALLFLIGFAWIWGLREIVQATEEMGILTPGIYFQICWKFIGVIILLIVFFGSLSNPEEYHVTFGKKIITIHPIVLGMGYVLAWLPVAIVPLAALHAYCKSGGKNWKQKLLLSVSPNDERDLILATGTGKRAKLSHYMYFYAAIPGSGCKFCCYFSRSNKIVPAEPEPEAKDVETPAESSLTSEQTAPTPAPVPIVENTVANPVIPVPPTPRVTPVANPVVKSGRPSEKRESDIEFFIMHGAQQPNNAPPRDAK